MVHRVTKSQTRLSMHAQVLLSDVAATPHPVTLPGPWLVAVVCLGSSSQVYLRWLLKSKRYCLSVHPTIHLFHKYLLNI